MLSNNHFLVLRDLALIATAFFVGGLIGMTVGISSERTRIYESCLNANASVVLQEARQKCENVVKR